MSGELSLIDRYDAALFDLDGVVYLGPEPVPGAAAGIAELRGRGVRIGFVTNNAARPPQAVVDQLTGLGIPCGLDDVVTSAQAGAAMLAAHFPPGSLIYIAGSDALAAEVRAAGMTITRNWRDRPVAVIQGYDPSTAWETLDGACLAIQRGAQWFATNSDLTRPTDLGLVPGAGAQVNVVRAAVATEPLEAGKPSPPLLQETMRRLEAERPIFVGDRLDTDILGANRVGIDSLFVFTGAHGKHDLVEADDHLRPTWIGHGVPTLLRPAREAVWNGDTCRVGDQRAGMDDNRVHLAAVPDAEEDQYDAVWAILQVAWRHPGADTGILDRLEAVK